MQPVNMLEAKSTLSRLVQAVEEGRESEIVIARNGRPVARLVPLERAPVELRVAYLILHRAGAGLPADARARLAA